MQKKKTLPQYSPAGESEWQKSLKSAEKKEKMKKYGIWAGIVIACFLGLVVLVKLAGTSASPTTNTQSQTVNNIPKVTENDIILGDKNAPVTIIEYGDFQCPTCAKYSSIINQVLEENQSKVRVVYRYFPLSSVHKNARLSAQAGYAANKQGKFNEMKDILYDKQNDWAEFGDPTNTFVQYAVSVGMDDDKFKQDMLSDEAKNFVLAAENKAISIGLQSTPTFIIGNKSVFPPDAQGFKELIDARLSKLSAIPSK